MMDIAEEIRNILFKIGQDIKIHKIDNDNSIIEVDYEKYTAEILKTIKEWLVE